MLPGPEPMTREQSRILQGTVHAWATGSNEWSSCDRPKHPVEMVRPTRLPLQQVFQPCPLATARQHTTSYPCPLCCQPRCTLFRVYSALRCNILHHAATDIPFTTRIYFLWSDNAWDWADSKQSGFLLMACCLHPNVCSETVGEAREVALETVTA